MCSEAARSKYVFLPITYVHGSCAAKPRINFYFLIYSYARVMCSRAAHIIFCIFQCNRKKSWTLTLLTLRPKVEMNYIYLEKHIILVRISVTNG